MELFKKIFGKSTEKTQQTPAYDATQTVILDVRTEAEFQEGHVQEAKNIDFYSGNFKERLSRLDKTKSYVLYCRSGNRSGQATQLMKQLGFDHAENLGSLQQASRKLGSLLSKS